MRAGLKATEIIRKAKKPLTILNKPFPKKRTLIVLPKGRTITKPAKRRTIY